jgi:hypothetical protein
MAEDTSWWNILRCWYFDYDAGVDMMEGIREEAWPTLHSHFLFPSKLQSSGIFVHAALRDLHLQSIRLRYHVCCSHQFLFTFQIYKL